MRDHIPDRRISSPAKRRLIGTVTVLVIVLVVGAWYVVTTSLPVRQARALDAIMSGDWPPSVSTDSSSVPIWLRRLGGWRYFSEVYAVDFSLHKQRRHRLPGDPPLRVIDDADLQRLQPELGRLPYLERLTLCDTAITDAGLIHLSALNRLRAVDLSGTRITDAGIPAIAAIPSLEMIDLSETRITAAGQQRLRSLKPGVTIAMFDFSETLPPRLP